MTFLLLVAAVVIFISLHSRQNERIHKLERAVYGEKTAPIAAVQSQVTKPASASVPLSPVELSRPVAQQTIPQKSEIPTVADVPTPTPQSEHSEISSGRLLGGIGIAAVFIGIAFFLNYAFENNWITPPGRVLLGIATGLVLMGLAQFLRKKYLQYSDLLMGGGLAILYLSFFSAHSFYHLISPLTAWFFMALITAVAFVISIMNATQTLAFVAIIGGFLTPFLASSGENDMLLLFAYMTLLNVGVLALSFYKKWPGLVVAAFLGTVINFGAWMSGYYSEIYLGAALSFCCITFIIFLISNVVRSVMAKEKSDEIDYISLGGNALFLSLTGYYLLAPHYHEYLGFASVLVALVYLVVAFMVNKNNREDTALNIFLPGLAVTFLSIAVPLQFSGPWISVAWVVESVALYTVAVVVGNRGFQVMGAITYMLGLMGFLAWNAEHWNEPILTPIFNTGFAVLGLAIVAAYVIAYVYHKYGSTTLDVQKQGVSVFVTIGSVLAILAVPHQFSGAMITVGWLFEALIFYGVSTYWSNRILQVSGATAYVFALVNFFFSYRPYEPGLNFTPIFNQDFMILVFAIITAYIIASIYKRYSDVTSEIVKNGLSTYVVIANILTVYAISSQIIFYYDGIDASYAHNYSNTIVSIFWALYAALLTALGFMNRIVGIRRLGLVLFFITAFKVVIDVWSLGQIYRIVSLIVFGVIALSASFVYAKYKDRLKDVI